MLYRSLFSGPWKNLPWRDVVTRICNNAEVVVKLGRSACRVIPDKREDHEASYKIESADSISNLYSLHMAPSCVAYKDYNPYKTPQWFRATAKYSEQSEMVQSSWKWRRTNQFTHFWSVSLSTCDRKWWQHTFPMNRELIPSAVDPCLTQTSCLCGTNVPDKHWGTTAAAIQKEEANFGTISFWFT